MSSVTLTSPEVQAGQTLFSSTSGYSVLEFIGEGCFGKVAKCQHLATKQTVAIKILKTDSDCFLDTEKEVSMLEVISVLNPDHANVVKFFERFQHMGLTCLAFEMLDGSLYDLLQERAWKPLSLNEIRPIAEQLLVTLDALKGLGVMHTDIKPDNIMFVNEQDQPLRVKLIDFGEAVPASKVQPGMELQPGGYRAPEVALGLPFTEAIDVWGIGCILAFLYLAENLFPVDCDYQMMKCMVEVLGQPEDHLLRAGKYTHYFFIEEEAADGSAWRLMTPAEYTASNNIKAEERHSFIDLPSSLDDLVNIYPKVEAAVFEDRRAFVDLMKQLLHLDGDQRISPRQAQKQPFITMSHPSEHQSDNAPATRSCDETTGSYDDGPATGSSDGGPVPYSYEESPASWPSDGELSFVSYEEDPASWPSDGELPFVSYEEDPASWPSDGELPFVSYEEDSASWPSDGELPFVSYEEDPASWPSDGELSFVSYEESPASWPSDGELPFVSYEEDSASWPSDGELSFVSYEESPASWPSDGELPFVSYEEDSASWPSDGELPFVSYEEDAASWPSDGELSFVSYEEDSASWPSDGELPFVSYEEDSASWPPDGKQPFSSFEEGLATWPPAEKRPFLSYEEGPAPWPSDGAQAEDFYEAAPAPGSSDRAAPSLFCEEDPAARCPDGSKLAHSTAAPSSGCTKKLRERIQRFFSQISTACCCCWRPAVED